jgi:hypothetical protein
LKKTIFAFATLVLLAFPAAALADTITFTPTPADMNDLDHHMAYTWRVNNVNLRGQTITGARLTIKNIRNWDGNRNMLFIHLLDTAKYAGVASFVDDPTNAVPVSEIRDDFVDTRYHNRSNWLVSNGTGDTFLTSRSFTTTAENFVLDLNAAQLNILAAYILNGGDFAFGLDPDCHFFNDGFKFEITTCATAVPEPTTIALLATGLGGMYLRRRKRQKVAQG